MVKSLEETTALNRHGTATAEGGRWEARAAMNLLRRAKA